MSLNPYNRNPIFRENAIKHLASGDEQSEFFTIISAPSWLWLLSVSICTIVFVSWLLLGHINLTVEGQGITMTANGKVFSVRAEQAGEIMTLNAQAGNHIKKGDVLATVYNPYVEESFNFAKEKYQHIAADYFQFNTESQLLHQELNQQLDHTQQLLKQKMQHCANTLADLYSLYIKKSDLYKKHYLTLIDLEHAKDEYLIKQDELVVLKQSLLDSNMRFKKDHDQLNLNQSVRYHDYLLAKHEFDLKRLEMDHGNRILSNQGGIINSVNVMQGDYVTAGQQLLTIVCDSTPVDRAKQDHKLEALIFVSQADGKKINHGMNAYILPNDLSVYDFGYIKGQVIGVSAYPATKESVYAYLGNASLVDHYFVNTVPYMVRIALTIKEQTKNQLLWTTKRGSAHCVKPGNAVSAKIIINRVSPLKLFLQKYKMN